MDRNTILWAIVAFFGATVAFQGIQEVLDDESTLVVIAAQAVALAAIVLLIVGILKTLERRKKR